MITATSISAVILFAFWSHKQVTLVIDGQSRTLTTFALTVGKLLKTEDIAYAEDDELNPAASDWLKEGAVVTLDRAIPIQVLADGTFYEFVSTERLPIRLLASAGLTLLPGDMLMLEGLPVPTDVPIDKPQGSISLQVERSLPFEIQQDTQVESYQAGTTTLGQALWKAGIILQSNDDLQPSPYTPLQANLKAQLTRAQPLSIQTANGEVTFRTSSQTIGEALAEAGLALQGLDYSDPPSDQLVPVNRKIRLVRVQEQVIIENKPLAFETIYEAAPDIDLDTISVIQTGEYGLTAQRILIRYEDGQETNREVEAEWIARQPKARILGYGTNVVKHSLDTPDGTVYYYRALTMWATSYSPADTGNDITATGQVLRKGLVAINPYYIPYGTQMYVPGYGYAEAADTGLLGPRWIDLGYSEDDYVAWHQNVTVYFLWPPPAQILWIYP